MRAGQSQTHTLGERHTQTDRQKLKTGQERLHCI